MLLGGWMATTSPPVVTAKLNAVEAEAGAVAVAAAASMETAMAAKATASETSPIVSANTEDSLSMRSHNSAAIEP